MEEILRLSISEARARLPEAGNDDRVPGWLRAPHTAWMTPHVVMLPVTFNESTEAPAPTTPPSLPIPSATPSMAVPLPPAATPGARVPR